MRLLRSLATSILLVTAFAPSVSNAQMPTREQLVANSKLFLQLARDFSAMERVIDDDRDYQIASDLVDFAMHASERSAAVADLLYLRSFVPPSARVGLADLFVRERMDFYAEATGPDVAAIEARIYRATSTGLSEAGRKLQQQIRGQKVLLEKK